VEIQAKIKSFLFGEDVDLTPKVLSITKSRTAMWVYEISKRTL
jgi:hypothetical protein